MIDALWGALGAGFASNLGVLVLGAMAAMIVILWDWRVALASILFLQIGVGIVLVQIHHVPGVLVGGQIVAIILATSMLALAATSTLATTSLRHAANWPLRLIALVFIIGAWWLLDPGYALPLFSLPETDLVIWCAICGLTLACFSGNPIIGGIAVLLWCTPLYAVAAVLLPGSGLAVMVGIAELLLTLACSYLALVEPAGATDPAWRVRFPLVRANQLRSVPAKPSPAPITATNPLLQPHVRVATANADAVLEKSA